MSRVASVFHHCGLAALSDLQNPESQAVLRELEDESRVFMARDAEIRKPHSRWMRDPLHTWSRVWEYPYAYYHLRNWRASFTGQALPHVVDYGSGVTFFPFAVAKLGFRVTCVDIDRICQVDMERAIECIPAAPGKVEFKLCGNDSIPLPDASADAVYCISVIEHMQDFASAATKEMARVLKPGGMLILTFDLDLRGDQAIGVEPYRRLREAIDQRFDLIYPERTIHPNDALRSDRSICPCRKVNIWLHPRWFCYHVLLKILSARRPSHRLPHWLTAMGLAAKKSSP